MVREGPAGSTTWARANPASEYWITSERELAEMTKISWLRHVSPSHSEFIHSSKRKFE